MNTFARLYGLIVAFALAFSALAADRTPRPQVIVEKAGQCVAATDIMRREHPQMLRHQRDRTMREGVRTRQHSLAGCIECHANAKTGSVLGEQGFCQSCHAYAGVKLDCFECHASKLAARSMQ